MTQNLESPPNSDLMAAQFSRLRHDSLGESRGKPIENASLTDKQKVAVVLQGAALLAHLEHTGLGLPDVWENAQIEKGGLLKVPEVRVGRSSMMAQALLRALLHKLFRGEEIAGRGAARRAARKLLGFWNQDLVTTPPQRALEEILETADFLWDPAFAEARCSLAGEHLPRPTGPRGHGTQPQARPRLWLAGPGRARRRFLAQAKDRRDLASLLASPAARDLWDDVAPGDDPNQLAREGCWHQAAAIWRRWPPTDPRSVLAAARCFYSLGRYSETLDTLKDQESTTASLLRLSVLMKTGKTESANAVLRDLVARQLSQAETLEVAEVAIRHYGRRRNFDASRDWLARAVQATRRRPDLAPWVAILAAEAAYDRHDLAEADAQLEKARPALDDPKLAGRWHQIRGQIGLASGDGMATVEHIAGSLRHDRRRLPPDDAARRWSDLACGRTMLDDLPGAERALRHAFRLLSNESKSRWTLVLPNLAETLMRRGRLDGLQEVLERTTAANRRTQNSRALILDLEMWIRLELTRGRCSEALAWATEAVQVMETSGILTRRPVVALFAARAHGWLGQTERAAHEVERSDAASLSELDPEERPALFYLAGQAERAAELASGTPWAGLWSALVSGLPPDPSVWDALDRLEPFRAARLVLDGELACPGTVPPARVRRAVAILTECGATGLAEKLEGRAVHPWRALARFLDTGSGTPEALGELFEAAGDGVRLTWRNGTELVLANGSGGQDRLNVNLHGGCLELEAPRIDSMARVFFDIARQSFEPPPHQEAEHLPVPGSRWKAEGILGESPVLHAELERLERLAVGDLPVLVLGESGTGKELAARRVHSASRRRNAEFMAVNSAALPESLIQSELFGHQRGAFTGAEHDRKGVFEAAQGGTVFLDEIGDLALSAQGKLLRVLQEGEIRRLGDTKSRKVDIRIVAATHRNLEEMVAAGTFRQDLFFRLKVGTIRLPPLRERGRDALLLAQAFLNRRLGEGPRRFSKAAEARLLVYPWPGNIRELSNVVEAAAALCDGKEIEPDHLDLQEAGSKVPLEGDYHQLLESFRRRLISDALDACGGNRAAAARQLGLSRQALSYMAKQLDLI